MARIRTIKPEFFTSEDIVSLSPMARLLYIATWCESDKEGRLPWKPATFKLRYFPGDKCDIKSICNELVVAGLVVLYGDGFAYVPSFSKHQHINPRESASVLPAPPEVDASPRVATRQDASIPDVHSANPESVTQGGREGKGREGTRVKTRATSIPEGFAISERVKTWAEEKGFGSLDAQLEALTSYAKRKGATYVDWDEALMTAVRDDWAKVGGKPNATTYAGAV